MNINNYYKNGRRQITSFLTVEIIETNSKYLEINSFFTLSNLFYREYLGRHRKVNRRNEFAKKRPLFLEVSLSFTKSSVSLFPLF